MAISTYGVKLMYKATADATAYTHLINIKSFPDLGGTPEMLETTTLSDNMQTYIPGVQTLDALEFEANYTLEDFKKLNALVGKDLPYAVWIGDEGVNGKFEFNGQISAFPTGGGVNEVIGLTISIAPSTPIKLVED